jgi:uncharacterized SAM-binding protein YcdF (DUF218 family)
MRALIVLGCPLVFDKNQSKYVPGEMLKMRLDAAIEAYVKFYIKNLVIITSGRKGTGQDYSIDETGKGVNEASVMKHYLVEHGIPTQRIFEEGHSRNTVENCLYSYKLLNELERDLTIQELHPYSECEESATIGPIDELYIITSDFHLPRSEKIFRHFAPEEWSINCIPASTPKNIQKQAIRNEAKINVDQWIANYTS